MKVEELIERLRQFDPQLPVIIGAEGAFQGSPGEILIQDLDNGFYQRYGKEALVIWAP